MEFPRESKTCGCHRTLSTQTCECQFCSGSNQEICGLCGNRVPSVCLSNEILIGNNLPDNTCQCFLSTYSEIDIPEKVDIKSEQETELAIVLITDSQNVDLLDPVTEEKSCIETDSNNISKKDDVEDSEESKTPEFSNSSNGYALSLDEQSDQNSTDHRNITSPSSGEDSKSSSNAEKEETKVQNLDVRESKDNLEHKNGNNEEYKHSDSSPSEEEIINNLIISERESNSSENMTEITNNENRQSERVASTAPGKFRFENRNIRSVFPRPLLPRPFPQPYQQPYQPYFNPVVSVPVFNQIYQPYTNPLINAPLRHTNFPGRFFVRSRPQLGTSYHQQPCATSFSKKLRAHTQKQDSESYRHKKLERVVNWLDEIKCNPPDEEPSDSDWASRSAQTENEHVFSGISTDERSSAEVSEEENRRQRSLRRPPRNTKRNKPK